MTTSLQTTDKNEKPMEYVPFGAADKIKLTVALIQTTICIPTKSGKICSVRDAVRFMMLCQAQRLNPYAGDCFLCGYDGKDGPVFSLITAHQSFLKRAETCDDYEGMESGVILCGENDVCSEREGDFVLESENCVGGWARVHRKGRKATYRRLSINAMKPNYETPFWGKFKAPGQIVKCAEADALRATFPTLLGGLYSGEELNMNATIASTGVIDVPAVQNTTQQLTEPGAPKERQLVTPQSEFEAIVVAEGCSFDQARAWLAQEQGLEDADAFASFSELPADLCKRMVRAKTGLVAALRAIKEAK